MSKTSLFLSIRSALPGLFALSAMCVLCGQCALIALCVACEGSCAGTPSQPPAVPALPAATPKPTTSAGPSAAPLPVGPTQQELARQAIAEALRLPAAPGAPGFDGQRSTLLARAKGEPLVFVRTPHYEATENREAQSLRTRVSASGIHAWSVLEPLLHRFYNAPSLGRAAMLREGYLYTEHPNLAFSYISLIAPEQLFDEEQIWLQRGENTWHAQRQAGARRYIYLDGPHQGGRVRLLHLDRLGVGEPPKPLHRDFRSLKYRYHFERARILHLTETSIVAELRYGQHWVQTLIASDGARLYVTAELIPPEIAAAVKEARESNAQHALLIQGLRGAMVAHVNDRLPFDEPKTEEGQEDGKLRGAWRWAYLEGRKRYKFRDDRYQVFNPEGAPLIPQVCVDFVLDTFERAAGTWWRPKDQPPGRSVGKWSLDDAEREFLRSSKYFVEVFAGEHPDRFESYTVPKRERIELGLKPKFFRYVADNADLFRPGDIVFIRGETPWDTEELHTHSFFIYESDPLTGTPILIAGNAGPANLWSWETEARRTPNRTLTHRVRPLDTFLRQVVQTEGVDATTPPVLVPTRD